MTVTVIDKITPKNSAFTGLIDDDQIIFTDITDGDSSALAHGFLPRLSDDATEFLNGEGDWVAVSGGSGAGASTFLDLTDTPDSYTSYSGQMVIVNSDEDGLEFIPIASGVPVTTAENDFMIGDDSPGTWVTKTLAETKTILGVTGGGLAWEIITANQTAEVNHGYIANKGTLLTLLLPATAAVNDIVRVSGMGAGGWIITQNASGVIHFGNKDTTVGVGGSLASVHIRDAVELICCVENNEWSVISSVGNLTVV